MNRSAVTNVETLLQAWATASAAHPPDDDPLFVARVMRRLTMETTLTVSPDEALERLRWHSTQRSASPKLWAGAALTAGAALAATSASAGVPTAGMLSLAWAGAAGLVAWALLMPDQLDDGL
jgi:hypothetical protein